jgi:uncharacterized protein with FMN-binding domain
MGYKIEIAHRKQTYKVSLPTNLMFKVEIEQNKIKSMILIYYPTKRKTKKYLKHNSINNIVLKDKINKKH